MIFLHFNPTANATLPNYPSTAKAVNAVPGCLGVTLEPNSCLKSCYVSKLTRMTSHRAVVVSYQALYINLGIRVLVPGCFGTQVNILGCRNNPTGNQCTNPHYTLSEEL